MLEERPVEAHLMRDAIDDEGIGHGLRHFGRVELDIVGDDARTLLSDTFDECRGKGPFPTNQQSDSWFDRHSRLSLKSQQCLRNPARYAGN